MFFEPTKKDLLWSNSCVDLTNLYIYLSKLYSTVPNIPKVSTKKIANNYLKSICESLKP